MVDQAKRAADDTVTTRPAPDIGLVKSRERVVAHGEVFTPAWIVDQMLGMVGAEAERIDSRFLEPACGDGNFLVPTLRRKLKTVGARYAKSEFERRHYALMALMSVYGVELLADNVAECRRNLVDEFAGFLQVDVNDTWHRGGVLVVTANVVHGNALTMLTADGNPITFAEWAYLGKGRYQRRDFTYEALTQRSKIGGSLFELLDEHEVFRPTRSYAPMTVEELVS